MKKLWLLLLLSNIAWASYSPGVFVADPSTPANRAKVTASTPAGTDEALACILHPNSAAIGVTGTFWQATQPVSSTQLPAALDGSGFLKVHEQGTTSAAQSGTWSVRAQDGSGNSLTSTGSALDVNLKTSSISIGTKSPVNANGNTGSLSVSTTEGNIALGSNAVCVFFEAESSNATNIRWGISNSTTAILNSTTGMLMEPGRDSSQCIPVGTGAYLHFIATATGTNALDYTVVLSQ